MKNTQKSAIRKGKSRRLMHTVAVGFGLIAILIMIKGAFDIRNKLKTKPFFDRIVESRDTLMTVETGKNRWILLPGGELKYSSFDSTFVFIRGTVFFFIQQPVKIFTEGGEIRVENAEGYVQTGRFQNIFLSRGAMQYDRYRLEGKNLYFNEAAKLDTLLNIPSGLSFPFVLEYVKKNADSLQLLQEGFRPLFPSKKSNRFYVKEIPEQD